jgi:hypothetical protein
MSMDEPPINLTCWYLNQRRLQELVGPANLAARLADLRSFNDRQMHLATLAAYKAAAVEYIRGYDIQPLGKLLMSGQRLDGQLFTHYSNFWFKGLSKLYPGNHPRAKTGLASGFSKLHN